MTSSMDTHEGLLACPFCGGEAKCNGHPGGTMGQIYCDGEECFGPRTTALTKQDSIVQWNTRAGVAQAVGNPSREAIARIISGTAFRPRHISGEGLSETEKEKWLRARNVAYYKADCILAEVDKASSVPSTDRGTP